YYIKFFTFTAQNPRIIIRIRENCLRDIREAKIIDVLKQEFIAFPEFLEEDDLSRPSACALQTQASCSCEHIQYGCARDLPADDIEHGLLHTVQCGSCRMKVPFLHFPSLVLWRQELPPLRLS